jgi:hypothetical protein
VNLFARILRFFALWICLPMLLGITFAIAPCYVLGRWWPMLFCGYKSAPPHVELQFWIGASIGLLFAFWRDVRRARLRADKN